jgi:hypothetical protein
MDCHAIEEEGGGGGGGEEEEEENDDDDDDDVYLDMVTTGLHNSQSPYRFGDTIL